VHDSQVRHGHSVDAALFFFFLLSLYSFYVVTVDSIDVMREYGISTSTGQRAFSGEEAARVAAKLSKFLRLCILSFPSSFQL
jgi:hypothetical protein